MSTLQAVTVTEEYSSGFLTVQIPGKTDPVRISAGRHLAGVAVGEQVLIGSEGARQWAVMLLGTAPPPPPPPPPPTDGGTKPPPEESTTVTGKEACPVSWSGTYRNGSRRGDTQDMYCGDWSGTGINRGAVSWGRKPSKLGTLTAGSLRLYRLQGGVFAAQPLTMLLLAGVGPWGSFPSILATASGPSIAVDKSATWSLPSNWLGRLASGEAGGIGIGNGSSAPYIHIAGAKCVLTLNWERTS